MILCENRVPFGPIFCKPGIQEKYFEDIEMLAAAELRHYLARITTAPFHTVDYDPAEPAGIYIGSVSGLSADDLGDDDFRIVFDGGKIRINGGKRGLLYGVYEFLERLGCRFFTPTCEKIPLCPTLSVEPFSVDGKPVFEYREMDYADVTRNPYYCTKMRLNGHYQDLPEEFGGSISYATHAHSFQRLVPVEEYGQSHPEYFSLFKGKRQNGEKDYWQLCLTNPDVLKIAIENARKILRENPDCKIISISQNDNLNHCQCEACLKADSEEGSPAGTLLRFVNAMAEALEDEFPDVLFDILAYHYTRPASHLTQARKNVCIRICASSTCYTHPYDTCPDRSRAVVHPDGTKTVFFDDLVAWSKVCDRLYVWDYTSNFQHYALPFPNWRVLQKNLLTLEKYHVKGVFEEANRAKGGGVDFNERRGYLLSKLLWDPHCDIEKHRREFMEYVYGPAAEPLDRYLNLLCDYNEAADNHMYIQQRECPPYLTEDHIAEYNALFDEAERLVCGDGLRLARVQRNRLSVRFCELYWKITVDHVYDSEKLHSFFDDLHEFGILKLDEWACYQKTYRALLDGRTDGGRWYTEPPVSDCNETF
ncbi:MAG: DUF4838 domain-containing protein [Clostridia bacterium]|nr:DUF4838 domain-containing protein [Clostridia bacterium]